MLPFPAIFHSVSLWSFIAILAAPILISLVDFIILARTRLIHPQPSSLQTPSVDDFTVLIPIFGHIRYLKNVDFLKNYASHVVLCTTDRESPQFYADLEAISIKYGFRVFRSGLVQSAQFSRPNPWRLFKNTLVPEAAPEINRDTVRDEIIRNSFSVVTSKYCIFIDGDTIVKEDLSQLVGLMNERNYDLASVRVIASRQDTLMEKLQAIEYELAMDARRVYPWLTSGAGMVAKTVVIKDIMSHHSLFFSGGDIEIGKLARLLGYHVGHLPVEFFTDVPSTFRAWFKQRIAWCAGGFRHAVVNLHSFSWRHPFFFIYNTVIVYLLAPLRWYEVFHSPQILPVIILLYWVMISLFHFRTWKPYYLLFPFYSLIQVLIIIPLGAFAYISMVRRSRNIGLIKLRFPHPLSSVSIRELQFSKILLLLGSSILAFFFFSEFITALLFFFSIPVSLYHFPAAILLTLLFSTILSQYIHPSHWAAFAILNSLLFAVVFLASLRTANSYFDISYDGNAYHQSAIIELASGWDPHYRYVTKKEVGTLDRWLNHYSKGLWYTESNIVKFLDAVEPAKATQFLLLAASICLSLYTLLHFPHLPKFLALPISLLISLNPVSLYQSLSFYVDGQLYSLLVCLLSLLALIFLRPKNYLYFLLAMCVSVLVNVKLTAIAYAGFFLAGGIVVFILHEKLAHLEKLAISSAAALFVGIFVIGFSPYVTNTIVKGNPLYPAAGPGAINIRIENVPQDYYYKSPIQILFLSAFSRAEFQRNMGQFSHLKSPFQLSSQELQAFSSTGPIEGGWGPYFGLALIASALALSLMFLLAKSYGYAAIAGLLSLIILVSCVANPISSVARYTPQFWLVPVLIGLIALMHRQIIIRVYGAIVCLVLAYNIYLVIPVYFNYNQKVTQEWGTKLSQLSTVSAPLEVNPSDFRLSFAYKFRKYHIPFRFVENSENCRRLFSNARVMSCPTGSVAGTSVGY